jgi:hypothetical protein
MEYVKSSLFNQFPAQLGNISTQIVDVLHVMLVATAVITLQLNALLVPKPDILPIVKEFVSQDVVMEL